jgi:serine/threonine-protein kinase
MGRVWLAYDPQIDRKVAIKIVRSFAALGGADREQARERFLREARSAGKLLHPGIVTLFDAGEVGTVLYLAMEYVEGETLDNFCRPDRILPLSAVVEMMAGAAEALGYAHETGIIHRDIKPANLMRMAETNVKIMDFGLARGAEANLTQEGSLLGTPSYMAPEQIRGQAIDGRSDLFSLGVVLYELLTGQKPFAGDSVSSVIYRIVNEDPADPTTVHERVTPELAEFLRRALAKRPEDRFQSGAEFAASLRDVASRMTTSEQTQPVASAARPATASRAKKPLAEREIPAAESEPPSRSSAMPFVLGIVFVIVGLAGGAYYFREEIGLLEWFKSAPVVYEATVRSEPAESAVFLDGQPFDLAGGGKVRFGAEEAAPVVTAEYRCRKEEYRLGPADAGGEVNLVLEPVELAYQMDLGQTVAAVSVNGGDVGQTPLAFSLDLCQENSVTVKADGYHDLKLDIPEGATPLEARTLLAATALAPIPKGMLVLPESRVRLTYFVDGDRVDKSQRTLELAEGEHKVRAINDAYWIDVTRNVDVVADQEVQADIQLPALTTLVVFAYPPNAKVDLRRPGGRWKYLDDVPVRHQLAAGKYEVRVTLKPTGEIHTRDVVLEPGSNPEIRISFGSRS